MTELETLVAFYHRRREHSDQLSLEEKLEQLICSPEITEVVIALGHDLAKVLFSLLISQCEVNVELFSLLQRRQTESGLKDLSVAILWLRQKPWQISEKLILALLNKTQPHQFFLASAKIYFYAKHIFQMNDRYQVAFDDAALFNQMKPELVFFYDALMQQNLWCKAIIVELGHVFPPNHPDKIIYCIQIYRKLIDYCALDTFYVYKKSFKLDSITQRVSTRLINICSSLEEKGWLAKEVLVILCCISEWQYDDYYRSITVLQGETISSHTRDAFFSGILALCQHKQSSQGLHVFFKFIMLIDEARLPLINPDFLETFSSLDNQANLALNSCHYLKKEALLTLETFQLVVDFYVSSSSLLLNKPMKKSRNHFSFEFSQHGSFYVEYNKTSPTFEIAKVIGALCHTNLIHMAQLIFEKIDVAFAEFILTLYYMQELNFERITQALSLKIRSQDDLQDILEDAYAHEPLIENDHAKHRVSHTTADLDKALAQLRRANCQLSESLEQFIYQQPLVLPTVVKLFRQSCQKLTSESINTVLSHLIRYASAHELTTDFIKLVSVSVVLDWPMTLLNPLEQICSLETFFTFTHKLQSSFFELKPGGNENWLLPRLKTNALSSTKINILIELKRNHTLTEALWLKIENLPEEQHPSIAALLYHLHSKNLCRPPYTDYFFQSTNKPIAADIIIQLAQAEIDINPYWKTIMDTPIPTLLVKGILLLHSKQYLTPEHADLLAQCYRPELAAKVLIDLIEKGTNPKTVWSMLTRAENPEEQLMFVLEQAKDTLTQEKQFSEFSPLIKQAIEQHTKPKQAIQLARKLADLPGCSSEHIAVVLKRGDAQEVVFALDRLHQYHLLSHDTINAVIECADTVKIVNAYLVLSVHPPELLDELMTYQSYEMAENRIQLFLYQQQLPDYQKQLLTIFENKLTDTKKVKNLLNALELLSNQGSIDQLALDILAIDMNSIHLANLIILLKRDNLYHRDYLKEIINTDLDNRDDARVRTIVRIGKEAVLNLLMIKTVTRCNLVEDMACIGLFATYPIICQHHIAWLNSVLDNQQSTVNKELITQFFERLINTKLLTIHLLKNLIALNQREAYGLVRLASIIDYIPNQLLDEQLINDIAYKEELCWQDEAGSNHVFKDIVRQDPSLLTKEVIQIAFHQSESDIRRLYQQMKKLKKAHLFQPEVVLKCTSLNRVDAYILLKEAGIFTPEILSEYMNEYLASAYIKLHQHGQLQLEHKKLLQKSQGPIEMATLLLWLLENNLYNAQVVKLLGRNSHHIRTSKNTYTPFEQSLLQLLNRIPSLNIDNLCMLLAKDFDWIQLNRIIYDLDQDSRTADSLLLIITSELDYLDTMMGFRQIDPSCSHIFFTDLARFVRYEKVLNHSAILAQAKACIADDSEAIYDTSKFAVMFTQLWQLCETGSSESILHLIQSTMFENSEPDGAPNCRF